MMSMRNVKTEKILVFIAVNKGCGELLIEKIEVGADVNKYKMLKWKYLL